MSEKKLLEIFGYTAGNAPAELSRFVHEETLKSGRAEVSTKGQRCMLDAVEFETMVGVCTPLFALYGSTSASLEEQRAGIERIAGDGIWRTTIENMFAPPDGAPAEVVRAAKEGELARAAAASPSRPHRWKMTRETKGALDVVLLENGTETLLVVINTSDQTVTADVCQDYFNHEKKDDHFFILHDDVHASFILRVNSEITDGLRVILAGRDSHLFRVKNVKEEDQAGKIVRMLGGRPVPSEGSLSDLLISDRGDVCVKNFQAFAETVRRAAATDGCAPVPVHPSQDPDAWKLQRSSSEQFKALALRNNGKQLVIVLNKYGQGRSGWIRIPSLELEGNPEHEFFMLHDTITGHVYVRRATELKEKGLYVALDGNSNHCFEVQRVYDSPSGVLGTLCEQLAGTGIPFGEHGWQHDVFDDTSPIVPFAKYEATMWPAGVAEGAAADVAEPVGEGVAEGVAAEAADGSAPPTFVQREVPELVGKKVVYLSMEMFMPEMYCRRKPGVPGSVAEREELPSDSAAVEANFSGGLGILAGCTMEGFAKAGIDTTAVIPMYAKRKVQTIGADGKQVITYATIDYSQCPNVKRKSVEGQDVSVHVDVDGNQYTIDVYTLNRGGSEVLLLSYPPVFTELYPGDRGLRLLQEKVMGRAVPALLRHLELKPDIFHFNEAHSILAAVHTREWKTQHPRDDFFDDTRFAFTLHTPREAGMERYYNDLCQDMLREIPKQYQALFVRNGDDGKPYVDLTSAALAFADRVNVVAANQVRVARTRLFPNDPNRWKITGIMNGSSESYWVSDGMKTQLRKPDEDISAEELWRIHQDDKQKVADQFARMMEEQGIAEMLGIDQRKLRLDPSKPLAIAIRRMVDYKSQWPMLKDIIRVLCAEKGTRVITKFGEFKGLGMQVVIGGTAHPTDAASQQWIDEFTHWMKGKWRSEKTDGYTDAPELVGNFFFLPAGTEGMGTILKMGAMAADVWLEMPDWDQEACGTSGMRAQGNGNPCVESSDGALEWLTEGENGYMLVPHTPARMLEILQKMASMYHAKDVSDEKDRWLQMRRKAFLAYKHKAHIDGMSRRYARELFSPVVRAREMRRAAIPVPAAGGEGRAFLRGICDTYSALHRWASLPHVQGSIEGLERLIDLALDAASAPLDDLRRAIDRFFSEARDAIGVVSAAELAADDIFKIVQDAFSTQGLTIAEVVDIREAAVVTTDPETQHVTLTRGMLRNLAVVKQLAGDAALRGLIEEMAKHEAREVDIYRTTDATKRADPAFDPHEEARRQEVGRFVEREDGLEREEPIHETPLLNSYVRVEDDLDYLAEIDEIIAQGCYVRNEDLVEISNHVMRVCTILNGMRRGEQLSRANVIACYEHMQQYLNTVTEDIGECSEAAAADQLMLLLDDGGWLVTEMLQVYMRTKGSAYCAKVIHGIVGIGRERAVVILEKIYTLGGTEQRDRMLHIMVEQGYCGDAVRMLEVYNLYHPYEVIEILKSMHQHEQYVMSVYRLIDMIIQCRITRIVLWAKGRDMIDFIGMVRSSVAIRLITGLVNDGYTKDVVGVKREIEGSPLESDLAAAIFASDEMPHETVTLIATAEAKAVERERVRQGGEGWPSEAAPVALRGESVDVFLENYEPRLGARFEDAIGSMAIALGTGITTSFEAVRELLTAAAEVRGLVVAYDVYTRKAAGRKTDKAHVWLTKGSVHITPYMFIILALLNMVNAALVAIIVNALFVHEVAERDKRAQGMTRADAHKALIRDEYATPLIRFLISLPEWEYYVRILKAAAKSLAIIQHREGALAEAEERVLFADDGRVSTQQQKLAAERAASEASVRRVLERVAAIGENIERGVVSLVGLDELVCDVFVWYDKRTGIRYMFRYKELQHHYDVRVTRMDADGTVSVHPAQLRCNELYDADTTIQNAMEARRISGYEFIPQLVREGYRFTLDRETLHIVPPPHVEGESEGDDEGEGAAPPPHVLERSTTQVRGVSRSPGASSDAAGSPHGRGQSSGALVRRLSVSGGRTPSGDAAATPHQRWSIERAPGSVSRGLFGIRSFDGLRALFGMHVQPLDVVARRMQGRFAYPAVALPREEMEVVGKIQAALHLSALHLSAPHLSAPPLHVRREYSAPLLAEIHSHKKQHSSAPHLRVHDHDDTSSLHVESSDEVSVGAVRVGDRYVVTRKDIAIMAFLDAITGEGDHNFFRLLGQWEEAEGEASEISTTMTMEEVIAERYKYASGKLGERHATNMYDLYRAAEAFIDATREEHDYMESLNAMRDVLEVMIDMGMDIGVLYEAEAVMTQRIKRLMCTPRRMVVVNGRNTTRSLLNEMSRQHVDPRTTNVENTDVVVRGDILQLCNEKLFTIGTISRNAEMYGGSVQFLVGLETLTGIRNGRVDEETLNYLLNQALQGRVRAAVYVPHTRTVMLAPGFMIDASFMQSMRDITGKHTCTERDVARFINQQLIFSLCMALHRSDAIGESGERQTREAIAEFRRCMGLTDAAFSDERARGMIAMLSSGEMFGLCECVGDGRDDGDEDAELFAKMQGAGINQYTTEESWKERIGLYEGKRHCKKSYPYSNRIEIGGDAATQKINIRHTFVNRDGKHDTTMTIDPVIVLELSAMDRCIQHVVQTVHSVWGVVREVLHISDAALPQFASADEQSEARLRAEREGMKALLAAA